MMREDKPDSKHGTRSFIALFIVLIARGMVGVVFIGPFRFPLGRCV